MRQVAAMVAGVLAGCSQAPEEASPNAAVAIPAAVALPTPAAAPQNAPAGWVGRWTGVEGMFVDIKPGTEPYSYRLIMQWDLDHRGTFDARQMPLELGLDFYRDGKLERLQPSDGNATGLKYLAGKKDCLTVKPGEGYCRD